MEQPQTAQLREPEEAARETEPYVHVLKDGIVCDTDSRGYAEPGDRSPTEIVLDASEGFIPVWAAGMTLRWRFQEHSIRVFEDPEGIKAAIKELFGASLVAWGDAAPVRFTERDDAWDFEIVMMEDDRCSARGCVLASAFFPDAGRHELRIYPRMFSQTWKEQIDTFTHELGHTFGLRHFFAAVSEQTWPSVVFGEHRPFSIMNYGELGELTAQDKADLTQFYQAAWSGELTEINRTPIRFVKPYHTTGIPPGNLVAVGRTLVTSGSGEPGSAAIPAY